MKQKKVFIPLLIYILIMLSYIIFLSFQYNNIDENHFSKDSITKSIIIISTFIITNMLLFAFSFKFNSIKMTLIVHAFYELFFIYLLLGMFGIKTYLIDKHFTAITGLIFSIINIISIIYYLLLFINLKKNKEIK